MSLQITLIIRNKIVTVDQETIRINGFKDMFKDVSLNPEVLVVCSITNDFIPNGLALIPSEIAKKIITSELWNDDVDINPNKIFNIIGNEFSYITKNELEEVLADPPFEPVKFFKGICPDSGVCLAFGRESKKITKFFELDTTFNNLTNEPLKLISDQGGNSVIRIVNFEKDGYKAKAVLKTTLSKRNSNLFYEYLVGQYINKQSLRFPCFIETYDLFIHSPIAQKELIQRKRSVESKILNKFNRGISSLMALKPTFEGDSCREPPCNQGHIIFSLSCAYSDNLSIMIQHIDGVSLLEMLFYNRSFLENDLINVLYQIYMPLATLADEFTHYDLHVENVMIYEPVKGYYFDYEYILADGTIVKFKSRYIAKIIDYGRAFFNDPESETSSSSSKKINDIVCNAKSCMDLNTTTFCGEEYGFPFNPKEVNFTTSKRNISHDLLLIYRIKVFLRQNKLPIPDNMLTLFEKLEYGNEKRIELENKIIPNIEDQKVEYTTTEKYEQDPSGKYIFNVKDAHRQLKDMVTQTEMNNLFSLGTLTIHASRRHMQFTPNFNPKVITLIIKDEITHVNPESIRIDGFKDMFKDVPLETELLVTCSITNDSIPNGLALIPSEIAKKIITSELWNDDDVDVDKKFTINDDEFSYITKNELGKVLADPPFEPVKFFKGICPESGLCLAFGRESKKITKFFDFATFKYLSDSKPNKISEKSINGFVFKLDFERDYYKASTVLKSTLKEEADNLLYEYLVGKYINKQSLRFSCFVETHEWFLYPADNRLYNKFKNDDPIKKDDFKILASSNKLLSDKSDSSLFGYVCQNSLRIAIMTQYIHGPMLYKKMVDPLNTDFINNDLIFVLFQIYMPLATLADEFTHYDLHMGNVMIYEPVKGKYIDYEYILADGTIVKFKSRYIAKIIDYGRSFFNDSTNTGVTGSSTKIHQMFIENKDCDELKKLNDDFAVLPTHNNIHADLRILNNLAHVANVKHFPRLYKLSKSIYDSDNRSHTIRNAYLELKQILIENKRHNDIIYNSTLESLGTLQIYENHKKMNFIPNTKI